MENQNRYNVASVAFTIDDVDSLAGWREVAWHYEPFIADSGENHLSIRLFKGVYDTAGAEEVFVERPTEEGMLSMRVLTRDDGSHVFELQQPLAQSPDGWLVIDRDFAKADIYIDENTEIPQWQHTVTLTSCIMLAYMLAATPRNVLIAHAASVLHDGKAYLFIAKSGTGKSTHSRLWLKNIPDCVLLNDDHPVVRADDGMQPLAYGSPWSGKTHCYKNLQAPLGAIVRIRRAPHNEMHPLSPILAYASLKTSFSGMPWHQTQGDAKHHTLENIIRSTPCYTIDCLPDDEAAMVCHAALSEK